MTIFYFSIEEPSTPPIFRPSSRWVAIEARAVAVAAARGVAAGVWKG